MVRALWFLVVLSALSAGAMWLADNPGHVRLEWQGYLIETSAALLFAAFAMVAVLSAILYRLWVFLLRVPAEIGRARHEARRRRGYLALTRGMVAVAAGDAHEARRQDARAEGLLEDPSLTMLLSAQAAQLNGDEKAAEKFFTKMLDRPEMEFLGLRGLLSQAMRSGDTAQALKWAQRAYQLKPKSEWLGNNLFDLQIRQGRWTEAANTLAGNISNRTVSPADARRRQAVLNYLMSADAVAAGNNPLALKMAKRAFNEKPDFAPAAVHYAGLLVAGGKARKAAGVLEGAWRAHPHPDLAVAYWPAAGANDPLARMKAAQKLTRGNASHPESRRVLAGVALEAGLWGDARYNLDELLKEPGEPMSAGVCRMMAELEERENNDLGATREWLYRAGTADPDPMWVCRDCGNTARQWTALCGKCQCFDGFHWVRPLNVPGIATASAAVSLAGPESGGADTAVAGTPEAPEVLNASETATLPPPAGGVLQKTGDEEIDEKSGAK